jgi:hypothetical protein
MAEIDLKNTSTYIDVQNHIYGGINFYFRNSHKYMKVAIINGINIKKYYVYLYIYK